MAVVVIVVVLNVLLRFSFGGGRAVFKPGSQNNFVLSQKEKTTQKRIYLKIEFIY